MSTATVTPNYQIVNWQQSPAQQNKTVTLQVDGASLTLNLTITWNVFAGYWLLTIRDQVGDLLLDSIPLLTGYYPAGNILGQYGYLKIGSLYLISTVSDPSVDYPTATNLGTDFVMVWGDTAP